MAADTLSFTATDPIAFGTSAPHTLTLTGSNPGTATALSTFAPSLTDQSPGNPTTVVKSGPGGWALSGGNTYTGTTTVNAGLLRVDGSLANTASVTVNAGGAIGGAGVIAAPISIAGGAAPGAAPAGAGGSTLTVDSDLALADGAALDYNLNTAGQAGGAGGNDFTTVSGNLTLGGNITLSVSAGPDFDNGGDYVLLHYGTLTDNSAGFSGWTVAGGYAHTTFSIDAANNNIDINLVRQILTWTGVNGGGIQNASWDTTGGSTNWADPTPAAAGFVSGSGVNVVFADANPLTPGVNVPNSSGLAVVSIQADGVAPASITFTNAGSAAGGVNYALANAGGTVGISGSTTITLLGTGGVTLQSPNSFTGAVAIQAGHLQLQDPAALGATSQVTVAAGGALELQGGLVFGNSAATGTIPLVLNGPGLAASPAGALDSVGGNNTYSGPITIGSGGATIAASQAGTTLTLTGGVDLSSGGDLTIDGDGTTVFPTGKIPLKGSGNLIKNGSGTANLLVTNTTAFTGATIVNAGTLQGNLAGSPTTSSLAPGQPLTINAGASVLLNAGGSSNDGLGYYAADPSLITINGGTLNVGNATSTNHETVQAVIFSGGTITSGAGTGSRFIFDNTVTTLAAATPAIISATQISLRGKSNFSSDAPVTFNVVRGTAPVDLAISSIIASDAAAATLIKTGPGILQLAAASTYTSGTQIDGGMLRVVNTSGSATGTAGVTVNSGATLAGSLAPCARFHQRVGHSGQRGNRRRLERRHAHLERRAHHTGRRDRQLRALRRPQWHEQSARRSHRRQSQSQRKLHGRHRRRSADRHL